VEYGRTSTLFKGVPRENAEETYPFMIGSAVLTVSSNRVSAAAECMGLTARVRMVETQKRGSAVQLHAK
jgi:hypothetical protein